jgi:tetratricopeptide (TPR) repeat protein
LAQIVAQRGDTARARDLLSSVDRSGLGSAELQARHDLAAGVIAYRRGQLLEAEQRFQDARQNVEKGSIQEANLLQNAASVALDLDSRNAERAKKDYLAAGVLYEKHADSAGHAQILNNLAVLPSVPWEEGRELLEQAEELARAADHVRVLGDVQLNMGRGFRIAGEFDKARTSYAEARKSYERAADPLGLAAVHLNTAVLEASQSRAALAKTELSKARARYATLSDDDAIPAGRLATLEVALADQFDALGEKKEAEEAYKQALRLCEAAGRAELEGDVRINYAAYLEVAGRSEEARQQLAQARELLDAFGGLEALGVYSMNRGRMALSSGDHARARIHYEQAVSYFEELGDPLAVAQALENLAALSGIEGKPDREAFRRVLATYREAEVHDRVVQTLYNLYASYAEPHPEAQKYLDELLAYISSHRVNPSLEVDILTQLPPSELPKTAQVSLRERLRSLVDGGALAPDPTGKALLQLARIEQTLGNHRAAFEYLNAADEFAGRVALPARVKVLSDLGMMLLVYNEVDRGIRRLFDAYDVNTANPDFAVQLLQGIVLASGDPRLKDTALHRVKLLAIRDEATDDSIRGYANEALRRLRGN